MDEDVFDKAIELTNIILEDFTSFIEANSPDTEKAFKIISIVFSAVMAQLATHIFKKNADQKIIHEYLDDISKLAKRAYDDAQEMMKRMDKMQ